MGFSAETGPLGADLPPNPGSGPQWLAPAPVGARHQFRAYRTQWEQSRKFCGGIPIKETPINLHNFVAIELLVLEDNACCESGHLRLQRHNVSGYRLVFCERSESLCRIGVM